MLEAISIECHDGAPTDIDVIRDLLLSVNSKGECIVRSRHVLFTKAVNALRIALASDEVRAAAQVH